METKIKRRYPASRKAEHKPYNDKFDMLLIQSNILNTDAVPSVHTILWDKRTIEAFINELENVTIPNLKGKLAVVTEKFERYCTQRVNQGHARPTLWPSALLTERVEIEAAIDVRGRELEFLQDKLTNQYIEPEQAKEISDVLAYGPRGHSQLRNGVLAVIDGQRVDMVDDNLVITTEGSPYCGMRVADYREYISKPWIAERRQRMLASERKRAAEIKATGHSDIVIRLDHRKIHPSSLPKWPDGVVNYLVSAQGTDQPGTVLSSGKEG